MLNAKIFEVRDSLTFLPVVAVLMNPRGFYSQDECYLLRRMGYPTTLNDAEWVTVALFRAKADGEPCTSDSLAWGDRTMATAHAYIEEHWNDLISGQVICVETILGERTKPKVSEQYE